jgi:hypothetical protein
MRTALWLKKINPEFGSHRTALHGALNNQATAALSLF